MNSFNHEGMYAKGIAHSWFSAHLNYFCFPLAQDRQIASLKVCSWQEAQGYTNKSESTLLVALKAQSKWHPVFYEVVFPAYTHPGRADCCLLYASPLSSAYFYCSSDRTVLQWFVYMSVSHRCWVMSSSKGRSCVVFIFILPEPSTVAGP